MLSKSVIRFIGRKNLWSGRGFSSISLELSAVNLNGSGLQIPRSSPLLNSSPSLDEIQKASDLKLLKPRMVPRQLRQSGDGLSDSGGVFGNGSRLLIDTRVRKGPFWHLSQEQGAWCYQIYNKTYHPRAYITPEEGGLMKEYEYLTKHVTMWNVAVERQIQIVGPDAEKFIDYVITRKADSCEVNKCRYVILTNSDGGILNDPVMLRPAENEFWLSLADSDIGMYLQGVNSDGRFNVSINEIDVAPVQIQGPKSTDLMRDLFGSEIDDMPYYGLLHSQINGCKVIISRTGFSAERGYEIYLYDATKNAEKMWYAVLDAGVKHNLRVIAPGHCRRIEAGILSYGQDFDIETNPYECGLGWQVDLTKDNFIGKDALTQIKKMGVTHKLVGIKINGGVAIDWYPSDFYPIRSSVGGKSGDLIGYVTSAWYSPTIGSNIALGFLPVGFSDIGNQIYVDLPDTYADALHGNSIPAEVAKTPFKIPESAEFGTGLRTTGSKL